MEGASSFIKLFVVPADIAQNLRVTTTQMKGGDLHGLLCMIYGKFFCCAHAIHRRME